jgi:FAD/FMN-containing dehydrogenase
MPIHSKNFTTLPELQKHLQSHLPSLYTSSKTSTVIAYDQLPLDFSQAPDLYVCHLGQLPSECELTPQKTLRVRGPVTWQEADTSLRSRGYAIRTSPTEQLASLTAGVATSCTGERCFSFGTLRSQILSLKYLDYEGQEKTLNTQDAFPLFDHSTASLLKSYQSTYKSYEKFKNAPYPRFQSATDLMTGTEGQLGLVTEVELLVTPNEEVIYMFLLLPRWEKDIQAHLEVFQAVQTWREKILSCELVDSQCMSYLSEEDRLGKEQDIIFLEIKAQAFEEVFSQLLQKLKTLDESSMFEIPKARYHHVRAGVPRAVFEANAKMGVKKMGTDCQVHPAKFKLLLETYQEFARSGIRYNLFGHFGDAHLHFNFMPTPSQTSECLKQFQTLYDRVLEWGGSPFAEHGVGLLKQKFIKPFYKPEHYAFFQHLKKHMDPYGQFFPQGYMSLKT